MNVVPHSFKTPKELSKVLCGISYLKAVSLLKRWVFIPVTTTEAHCTTTGVYWEHLEYGAHREVLLLKTNRRFRGALILDRRRCVSNSEGPGVIYPPELVVPIASVEAILDARPLSLIPLGPIVDRTATTVRYTKEFYLSVFRAVFRPSTPIVTRGTVWPPIHLAAATLGGEWRLSHTHSKTIEAQFGTAGALGDWLVGHRLCTLNRGLITVDYVTATNALNLALHQEVIRKLRGATAENIRDREYQGLAPAQITFLESIRPKVFKSLQAQGSPPKCVSCALGSGVDFRNNLRWQLAQTINTYASLTGQPRGLLHDYVLELLTEQGHNKERVSAMRKQLQYTTKPEWFPCLRRKRPSSGSGLWCPYGATLDGVRQCFKDQQIEVQTGAIDIESVFPAMVWARSCHRNDRNDST